MSNLILPSASGATMTNDVLIVEKLTSEGIV